jgi:hypothetical protein
MNQNQSDQKRPGLDELLSALLGRFYGAIDFWTIVCLDQLPPDPRGFIVKQCDELDAIMREIRQRCGADSTASREQLFQSLDELQADVKSLRDVFLVLACHGSESLENISLATERLKSLYQAMPHTVQMLAKLSGLALAELPGERGQYLQGILANLLPRFHELHQNSAAKTAPAGSARR